MIGLNFNFHSCRIIIDFIVDWFFFCKIHNYIWLKINLFIFKFETKRGQGWFGFKTWSNLTCLFDRVKFQTTCFSWRLWLTRLFRSINATHWSILHMPLRAIGVTLFLASRWLINLSCVICRLLKNSGKTTVKCDFTAVKQAWNGGSRYTGTTNHCRFRWL